MFIYFYRFTSQQVKKCIVRQGWKHNINVFPDFTIIMALDVEEHTYYIECKNDRTKFVENF